MAMGPGRDTLYNFLDGKVWLRACFHELNRKSRVRNDVCHITYETTLTKAMLWIAFLSIGILTPVEIRIERETIEI
jgi:hypothetical protein